MLLLEDRVPGSKWWWRWIGPPPWSISAGGALVLAAFVAMLGCFVRYWAHDHLWQASDNQGDAERSARTLGQVSEGKGG